VRSGSVCPGLSTMQVCFLCVYPEICVHINAGNNNAIVHQLQLQMTHLKTLCVTWQAQIRAIPCAYDVGPSWGPSDEMLADIAAAEVTGHWDIHASSGDNQISTDSDLSDPFDEDSVNEDSDGILDEYESLQQLESGDEDIITEGLVSASPGFKSVSSKRVRI
jgi:hypothetical protein